MIKEAVNKSYELNLREGLHFERRLFHSTFATVRTLYTLIDRRARYDTLFSLVTYRIYRFSLVCSAVPRAHTVPH